MEIRHVGKGNVVPMDQARNAMNFPAIAQVDAYWEGLRDGRAMPDRAEVDPRGLDGALEFAFMLEQIAPTVGRVRVAGMHLNDVLGMEVRGMPLSAFFDPVDRDRLGQALQAVTDEPKVIEMLLTSERGIGRPKLTARLYLAPLSNGSARTMRILGCLQTAGKLGRTPRRFRIQHIQERPINITRQSDDAPAQPLAAKRPVKTRALAEDAAIFRHAPKQPRKNGAATVPTKHAHLRLVKTDS